MDEENPFTDPGSALGQTATVRARLGILQRALLVLICAHFLAVLWYGQAFLMLFQARLVSLGVFASSMFAALCLYAAALLAYRQLPQARLLFAVAAVILMVCSGSWNLAYAWGKLVLGGALLAAGGGLILHPAATKASG